MLALHATLGALPANAEADGTIAAGWLDHPTLSTEYLFGDFTLRAETETGRWQAAIGMFGVVGRLHETYADITYDAGSIRASIGFPRPAYDRVAQSALTSIMPRLALETIGTSRSQATYGTMYFPEYLPYGVVIAAESATTKYAASMHGVPDYDTVIAGAGGAMMRGGWRYELATEVISQADQLHWNAKAAVQFSEDNISAGVGAFYADANGQSDSVELSAAYDLTSQLTIQAMTRQSRDDAAITAVGAKYDLPHGLSFTSGAALTGDTGVALSAAIRFRF